MTNSRKTQAPPKTKAKLLIDKKSSSRKISNNIRKVVYETAKDMFECGAIDQTTMREYDTLQLKRIPDYTPTQIKAIRQKCNASQGVLAAYMNISASALQKWETGARKPDNIAMKLLQLVDAKGLEVLIV